MIDVLKQVPQLMSIGELSRITGVNTVTLRAWERRHGLLQPERNQKGHRYYRRRHFEEVQEILKWLERGYSIGKVQPILQRRSDQIDSGDAADAWQNYRQELDQAARSLDERQLDRVVNEVVANYPIDLYTDRLLLPWLNQWVVDHRGGMVSGITFHFALNFLRTRLHNKLFQLSRSRKRNTGYTVLFASVADARYDVHFYLYANLLADYHYDVVPVHACAAVVDLPQCLEAVGAGALLLFANNALDTLELASLRRNAARFLVPVAVMGDALQVQHHVFSELSFDLVNESGSQAVKTWVMRRGEAQ